MRESKWLPMGHNSSNQTLGQMSFMPTIQDIVLLRWQIQYLRYNYLRLTHKSRTEDTW